MWLRQKTVIIYLNSITRLELATELLCALFRRTECFRPVSFLQCNAVSPVTGHRVQHSPCHNFIPWSIFKEIQQICTQCLTLQHPYTANSRSPLLCVIQLSEILQRSVPSHITYHHSVVSYQHAFLLLLSFPLSTWGEEKETWFCHLPYPFLW